MKKGGVVGAGVAGQGVSVALADADGDLEVAAARGVCDADFGLDGPDCSPAVPRAFLELYGPGCAGPKAFAYLTMSEYSGENGRVRSVRLGDAAISSYELMAYSGREGGHRVGGERFALSWPLHGVFPPLGCVWGGV